QTYTIFVKTGFEEKSLKLELSLGKADEGTGYAFFDNVIYSTALTQETFESESAEKKIDLTKNDWSNLAKATNGVYSANDWTATNNVVSTEGSITAGVIDTAKYGDVDGYNESSFENPRHPQGTSTNVLMIKSLDDTYYTFKSGKYSITSGEYYKISVWVKTNRLGQDEANVKYQDENETKAYPIGATINVNGIDATFTGIDTENEWKEYTIYINCTASNDIAIELSLGSENAYTKGAVYYSTTSITKIDNATYTAGISVLNNENEIDNVLAIGNTDVANESENGDNEENSSSGVQFNWLVVPSLITGVAILFAVVMVIYRNVKKNAPKKAKIVKPYSRENIKKLEVAHKQEVLNIKEKKAELVKMQNQTAIDLNNARRTGSNDTATLENRYNDLTKKIETLDNQKKQADEKYKQKLADLKDMKKAENVKR
ncbi:MAG: hypothetical protein J6T39_00170, partial [Clostridia bacterium]|nr:hypothetical protein [Clostridia bacterium]